MIFNVLITKFARHNTAKDLYNITPNYDSLCKLSALKNGLYEQLETKEINSTKFPIDFSLLFTNDNFHKEP